ARVVADPLLKLYFKNVDVAGLQLKFQKYVTYALNDRENAYDGPTMYEAHAGRNITDEAVDLFLEILRETMTDEKIPAETVEQIVRKLTPVKDVVVDKFVFPGTYVYKPDKRA
ncbi:MAG TPA: group 1 truncated hemoglobin, partial [Blastocatellia bacterium]|nr:group 1 truncated hemoglobin [Blastocatellia bacterium]